MKATVNIFLNAPKVLKINNPKLQFKLRIQIFSGSKNLVGFGLPSLFLIFDNCEFNIQDFSFKLSIFQLNILQEKIRIVIANHSRHISVIFRTRISPTSRINHTIIILLRLKKQVCFYNYLNIQIKVMWKDFNIIFIRNTL